MHNKSLSVITFDITFFKPKMKGAQFYSSLQMLLLNGMKITLLRTFYIKRQLLMVKLKILIGLFK